MVILQNECVLHLEPLTGIVLILPECILTPLLANPLSLMTCDKKQSPETQFVRRRTSKYLQGLKHMQLGGCYHRECGTNITVHMLLPARSIVKL